MVDPHLSMLAAISCQFFLTDLPKPMTTLVGRLLPVPAKLNLITQVSHLVPNTLDVVCWHFPGCTYLPQVIQFTVRASTHGTCL